MKQRTQTRIRISVADQQLVVTGAGGETRAYPISTSRYGLGFKEGSMKTPTGKFRVSEKIGARTAVNTLFKNRKAVGGGAKNRGGEDLIMSRILWLHGLGKRNANTHSRYIYIHGTNHEAKIGTPASHGCVRMRNRDIVELFDLVEVGTPVTITLTTGRVGRGE
jgi:lipoprotein-anchoring transpeptidase ErfK/SrfK